MSKIQTYEDLVAERESLEKTLAIQKEIIRADVVELKKELRPAKDLLTFLAKITTKDKSNSLVSLGVDLVGDVLIKNLVLAKAGWITRLIVPFLMKNYGTNFLTKGAGGNFLQKISDKLRRVA
ncbi:MAG: hypothetical protein HOP08_13935 [Cyclobacteriaceae bacterium]|nr:hypothetical protein [Cyclobacteriaceae bacterium]